MTFKRVIVASIFSLAPCYFNASFHFSVPYPFNASVDISIPFQLYSEESRSEEKLQAPQASRLVRNDLELTTPLGWTMLHRLQAENAPEAGLRARHRDLEGEDGQHLLAHLRFPFREDLNLMFRMEHALYDSQTQGAKKNLNLIHGSLFWDRKDDQWRLGLENGYGRHMGGHLSWQRRLQAGAGVALTLSKRSIHESFTSMELGEVDERASLDASFSLPREFFITGQTYLFKSRIVKGDSSKGRGHGGTINVGWTLFPKRDARIGWQFYNNTFEFNDTLRQILTLKLTQSWENFNGEDLYLAQLGRTEKARGQTVTLEWGQPFSQHFGLSLEIYSGQDLERNLGFGKIKGLNSRLLWIPTHITRFEWEVRTSSENTGTIRGDIIETSLSWHVNF